MRPVNRKLQGANSGTTFEAAISNFHKAAPAHFTKRTRILFFATLRPIHVSVERGGLRAEQGGSNP